MNKERLDISLELYSSSTGKETEFTAEDISEGICNNTLNDIPGLPEFVEWYIHCEGDKKTTEEYLDEVGQNEKNT